jgi:alkyl hydroperoxide reductase subunit F
MYDVIIIGGGPGGAAAAIYCARKRLKTLLVTESFGGQSMISSAIENWIGTEQITGEEFAKALERHVRKQEDIEIKMPARVLQVKEINESFQIETETGEKFDTKTVIIASGGRRRRLQIPGEVKFEGKGVVFCSTCDAPLFRNKTVAVIGGGNAALEAVVDLLSYAKHIYLMVRSDQIKGDPSTFEEVKHSEKVTIIFNVISQEILGEEYVTALRYKDQVAEEIKDIPLDGVFVEIGSTANSEFVKDLVHLNVKDEIIIDQRTGATSKLGIFAAGDVTDEVYKQNNISAGDGVKAALSANIYLLNRGKNSQNVIIQ